MNDSFSIQLESPLRQLLSMQMRGKVRRTWKKLSSPRRAIPTAIVGILLLLYCAQIYIALAFNDSFNSVPIETIAPVGMLSIMLLKLLAVCIDRTKSGAGFRHEEVHCLLGGPFSQQQVRLYRICGHAVSIFLTSIFAAIFFRFHVSSFAAALSGAYLAMMFTYLVYTAVAIAAMYVGDSVYRLVRNVVCGFALAVLGYVLYRVALRNVSNLEFLRAFGDEAILLSQTSLGRVLVSPFVAFTNIVVAESIGQWTIWFAFGLLLNYIALQLVMRLEVYFVRQTDQRERKLFEQNRDDLTDPSAALSLVDKDRFAKPLPQLFGAGPIVWRQFRALAKLKGGLGWLLIPLGLAFAAGGYLAFDPDEGALQTIAVIVVLTSVFLPGLLPFDFRGDLKGLTALKMMPMSPLPVVLGQLFVPVCLLSLFQLLALSTLVLHDANLVSSVLLTFCFLLPTNTIIIALENLIFLLYPYRIAEFDAQATVRRVVMLMAKFCVIFCAGFLALLFGLGVVGLKMATKSTQLGDWVASMSWPLTITGQMIALTTIACLVVRTTCWAYQRFDLSEDMPS